MASRGWAWKTEVQFTHTPKHTGAHTHSNQPLAEQTEQLHRKCPLVPHELVLPPSLQKYMADLYRYRYSTVYPLKCTYEVPLYSTHIKEAACLYLSLLKLLSDQVYCCLAAKEKKQTQTNTILTTEQPSLWYLQHLSHGGVEAQFAINQSNTHSS